MDNSAVSGLPGLYTSGVIAVTEVDFETIQFMHFGIPTFWDPPESFLYTKNPTYHDCKTTTIDHGPQTEGFYPCLNPNVWNPTDLDPDDWVTLQKINSSKISAYFVENRFKILVLFR